MSVARRLLWQRPWSAWRGYAATVIFVGLATATGALGRKHLALPDLVMLYLLTIMLAATLFGRGPSLVAATLSVLAYDFFFIPPIFTFVVEDERHLLTFAMMFVVGLLISGLTLRVRRHEQEARAREGRTAALYSLSRDLSSAVDADQAARVLAQHAKETFQREATVFVPKENDLAIAASSGPPLVLETSDAAAIRNASRSGDRRTIVLPKSRMTCARLEAGGESFGVLVVLPAAPLFGTEQLRLIEAFAQQGALALQRARFADEAKGAALRAQTEGMRNALLSAVSHDLRTPLAAITGAATTLRDGSAGLESGEHADLLDTICEEADRLERLVRNLLDMTRLESGALDVKREWVPLEEIVGSALTRLEAHLTGRPIHIDLPSDLPLLPVDAVLIEQVFVNLFENVAKYTPAGTSLDISARANADALTIEVADRGAGLPVGSESRIFERFFRARHAGVPGAGLGLAICQGIVHAHGGKLAAENREGGGAVFRLTIPLVGRPPSMPSELEAPLEVPQRAVS